jgi:hypothetical protein
MTIFHNINASKMDSFLKLIDSCKDPVYMPVLHLKTRPILKSDAFTKAVGCARILVEWQNQIDEAKNEPKSKVLFSEKKFTHLKESQQILNKLKRKFSRLIVENMTPDQQEALTKEVSKIFGAPDLSIQAALYLFDRHGDDSLCLKIIGQFADHPLNAPAFLVSERVRLLGESDSYEPDARFLFTVSSTAEQFPIAGNTWGYEGQESTPLTQFTEVKGYAVRNRLSELRDKNDAAVEPKNPWEKAVNLSAFKKAIRRAKNHDGSLVGNCGERGRRVFQRLSAERSFDLLSLIDVGSGDHLFVIAQELDNSESHVLDPWNGAKVYSKKDINDRLYDYIEVDKKTGKPRIKKFDPKKQHLDVVAYNIYPLDAFKKDSKTKHPYLIQLLDEFHEISRLDRKEKMIKALDIIQFIETKMPLFEYVDPAVNELYDQMLYLTKKERKNGLILPSDRVEKGCRINQALQKLDLDSLRSFLKEKKSMDSLTILHAIKASLRKNDIRYLMEVVDAGVPIESNLAVLQYDSDPADGLVKLAVRLTVSNGPLDVSNLCARAVKNHKEATKN